MLNSKSQFEWEQISPTFVIQRADLLKKTPPNREGANSESAKMGRQQEEEKKNRMKTNECKEAARSQKSKVAVRVGVATNKMKVVSILNLRPNINWRKLILFVNIVYLTLNFSLLSSVSSQLTSELGDSPPLISNSSNVVEASELSNNQAAGNNSSNKLKPINFTLVDEIFEASLPDDELVKRWKQMDSQMQDGMKSILKMVFPQIVAISQDAKVSGDCSGGILKWILSLRNLRSWAIKMLDASGKPSAGIFEGSLTMFGNYRQCLGIRAPDEDEIEITEQFEEYFRGQFCVLHLKPWMPVKQPFYHLNSTIEPLLRKNYKYYEKTLYDELAEIAIAFNFLDIRMDLCVPSTCTVADIQRVAELLSKKLEMRAKVMRCDIATREISSFHKFDYVSNVWLALPVCLASLALFASLLSIFCLSGSRSRYNKRDANGNQSESTIASLLDCLSFGGAIRDRFQIPGKPNLSGEQTQEVSDETELASSNRKALPLYGLRNVFVFWFIIVQMTMELKYQYLRESLVLRNMIISFWPFQIIVNSCLLFESLIIITAFTYSYTCMESTLKELVGYIVDKFTRLVLPIITLIALTIITPFLAIESPVWRNFVEDQSKICKSTGYLNIFFLQNFISYEKICLPHTWLFCVEMQLILLSIPLILLLKRTFVSTEDLIIIDEEVKLGRDQSTFSLLRLVTIRLLKSKAGIFSSLLIILGLSINFFTIYTNQLPPSWFYTFPDVAQKNYYFGQYLTKTWTHLSVFIIGLLAGHLCRSCLQLRAIRLLKLRQVASHQQSSQPQQPSPASSSSISHQSQLHRSTSTILDNLSKRSVENSLTHSSDGTNEGELAGLNLGRASFQLAVLICMSTIIFSTYTWSTQEVPSALVAALYDFASRLVWSLALVVLMLQLCLPDYRTNKWSTLSKLLSHPVCFLLGRLSFLAYLLSPYVHTFTLAVEEQSLFPSLFLMFHVIVGNIVITYILALILAIVIEQPLRRLISRFVFGRRFSKQKINISTYYINASDSSIPTISSPMKSEN